MLALIGLFATLFVVSFDAMLRQSETDAVESAFWQAAREARTRALVGREVNYLRIDAKEAAFLVETGAGGGAARFAIDRSQWPAETRLELALQKRLEASQFSLVGGRLVELRDIPEVRFFPDGTCTPFVFSLRVGSVERTIDIDPWTGAALLAADEG